MMSKAERIFELEQHLANHAQRIYALEQHVMKLLADARDQQGALLEERRINEIQRDGKSPLPHLHNRTRDGRMTVGYGAEP